jgi:hypothetical protein
VRMGLLLVRFDIISTGVLLLSSSSPFFSVGGHGAMNDPAQHPVHQRHLRCYRFLIIEGEEMLIDYLNLDNVKS